MSLFKNKGQTAEIENIITAGYTIIDKLSEDFARLIYIMRNFSKRKNLKSPETMEVKR